MIGQSMMKLLDIMKNFWAFIQLMGLQCVRFNSKYRFPDTECVDAFNASWTEENNCLVPSPNLIAKVINKFVSDRVKAILIIPDKNRLHSGRCCMMVKILKVL